MKQPELNPTSEKIDKIINRINSGDIKIPAFQRVFVWNQNQILELLESIINNFPIGSILLWNSKEILNHTRNIAGYKIPDTKDEYPVNYVLDGQQRISTIFAVFCENLQQDINQKKYNPDIDLFEIYYDFKINSFVSKQDLDRNNNHILLRHMFNASSFFQSISKFNADDQNKATDLYSKFINYEVPVVTIKHRTKDEVGVIFERINNTGTKLSKLDLMTAWTWTDDFHLINEISSFKEELVDKSFDQITDNIIIQIIGAVIINNTKTPDIMRISGKNIRNQWNDIKESVKKAIDFLHTEMNCINIDFLPYHQMLIPITKFYSYSARPTSDELKHLKRWFWRVAFSNRYSKGSTTTKMNSDLEMIDEIKNKNFSTVENYKISTTRAELYNSKFSKGNYLSRSFLLLMSQHQPIDLAKGIKIDIGRSLSAFNRKEYHHVFPNAYLKSEGLSSEEIGCIANFCFLPSDSNKLISNKKPSDYFFNIISDKDFDNVLSSNLLPNDKDIYKDNKYSEFLIERSEIIMTIVESKI